VLTTMIFVKNFDAMTAFYRDGFGLSVQREESMDGYTVLAGDGIRLALHATPDHISRQIVIADPPEARSDTAIKPLFGVDDPGAVRTRLEGLGGQAFDTGDDDTWDVLDPEGNVLRIHLRSP
jgi:catechol 2,3-dioxygenase-like lactoylglutathione lyase family enzyme